MTTGALRACHTVKDGKKIQTGDLYMTRTRQKLQERLLLDRFIDAMGDDAPAPAADFADSENPDFLLHQTGKQVLGIEMYEFHHPTPGNRKIPPSQEQGICGSISQKVEQKWQTSEMPWGEMSIHFVRRNLPKKGDEPKVVDALLSVISRTDSSKETFCVDREELWRDPVLGQLVQSITIGYWPGLDRPYVHAPFAAFLPDLTRDVLQEAIAKKDSRCEEYRKKCSEVWLVLVHDQPDLATHFSPRHSGMDHPFELGFDRLWLLDYMGKSVMELNCDGS